MTPCFWPEVQRGGERYVRDLADGLLARGHRPRLITSHPGPPRRSMDDGLPVTRHWRPPDSRLVRRGYEQYLTHLPFSYLDLRRGDDDVAHAHFPTDALAAARWTRRTGRPSILTYHGIPNHPGLTSRRFRASITERVVRECSAVTAVSRASAEAFSRWLGVEARVIHPGVDLTRFTPNGERSAEPTIFSAATPDEARKRLGLLIEAFKLVRGDRRDARLVLLRPRDPSTAAALLEASPGVELMEPTSDPKRVAEVYGRSWVSALPSVGDSFGIVLIESLASGTPVVASNRDALPEVVDSDSIGRLFDGDGSRALADALLEAFELAQDPGCREACRHRAEQFSIDRCVEEHLRLYRELLAG
jgi:glycosyltransferase involved in cell wall biosynthesis